MAKPDSILGGATPKKFRNCFYVLSVTVFTLLRRYSSWELCCLNAKSRRWTAQLVMCVSVLSKNANRFSSFCFPCSGPCDDIVRCLSRTQIQQPQVKKGLFLLETFSRVIVFDRHWFCSSLTVQSSKSIKFFNQLRFNGLN